MDLGWAFSIIYQIKVVLEKILKKVAPEKLWVNPDCGLKTRQDKEVKPSLKNL
ncbi:MAG: hypothetical protein SPL31_11090, partial [Succinivibrio sp.]|nr:hypothetical protein [Succinivibrio sp.]